MERTDILAFVVSTGILDECRSKDTCLDELINIVFESPEIWRTHTDIAVSSSSPVPASQIERTFRIRLEGVPDEPGMESLKIATKQLVDYCAAHPDASIDGVTFNCPEHSYGVFYGQVNERLDVICVMVGKHIPEYALRQWKQ